MACLTRRAGGLNCSTSRKPGSPAWRRAIRRWTVDRRCLASAQFGRAPRRMRRSCPRAPWRYGRPRPSVHPVDASGAADTSRPAPTFGKGPELASVLRPGPVGSVVGRCLRQIRGGAAAGIHPAAEGVSSGSGGRCRPPARRHPSTGVARDARARGGHPAQRGGGDRRSPGRGSCRGSDSRQLPRPAAGVIHQRGLRQGIADVLCHRAGPAPEDRPGHAQADRTVGAPAAVRGGPPGAARVRG